MIQSNTKGGASWILEWKRDDWSCFHVHTNHRKDMGIRKNTNDVFIDFKLSIRCIDKSMLRVMRSWGFEGGPINAVEGLYNKTETKAWKADIVTGAFPSTRGVCRYCLLSWHAFNLNLENIMLETLRGDEGGVEMRRNRYTKLRYAGYIMVITETTGDLQIMVQKVEE